MLSPQKVLPDFSRSLVSGFSVASSADSSIAFQGVEGATESPSVAVLFAKTRSIYNTLPGCDVWDEKRDARLYMGNHPVIAHPPCRAWGKLRHFSKHQPHERHLAMLAVAKVRINGGVLEHPAGSTLWPFASLPLPGHRDDFGGWTLPILQSWFGHRAPKATWLYFCGVDPSDLPPLPFELGIPSGRIEQMGRSEREATPPALASWLLDSVRVVCNTRTKSHG